MLVSLQKLFRGMELITTVMTDPSCRRGCLLSRIYKKTVKRRNCRVMEFVCLCLPSQIWVKQSQPAKYRSKLSQIRCGSALADRSRSSPVICVQTSNWI